MSLGKNVKALRKAKGWDQKKLSLASGVAVGTISAIEVRDSVRSEFAPALASALGVSVDQLLGDDVPISTGPIPPKIEELKGLVVSLTSSGKMQMAEVEAMIAMLKAREDSNTP